MTYKENKEFAETYMSARLPSLYKVKKELSLNYNINVDLDGTYTFDPAKAKKIYDTNQYVAFRGYSRIGTGKKCNPESTNVIDGNTVIEDGTVLEATTLAECSAKCTKSTVEKCNFISFYSSDEGGAVAEPCLLYKTCNLNSQGVSAAGWSSYVVNGYVVVGKGTWESDLATVHSRTLKVADIATNGHNPKWYYDSSENQEYRRKLFVEREKYVANTL